MIAVAFQPAGAVHLFKRLRVLDLVLTGEIDVATDDRILAEYREVLARPSSISWVQFRIFRLL
jgi:hypothetical protein